MTDDRRETQRRHGSGRRAGDPLRLAIVEDLADLAALYQVLLNRHVVVVVFSSAVAAKAWTGWDTVDAVVADNKMPVMQGHELLAWLAEAHPHVGRVLVTAHSHLPQEARASAHVFVDKLRFVEEPETVLGQLP